MESLGFKRLELIQVNSIEIESKKENKWYKDIDESLKVKDKTTNKRLVEERLREEESNGTGILRIKKKLKRMMKKIRYGKEKHITVQLN